MNIKRILNIGFSLTLPLLAVLFLGFTLNYAWKIEQLAMVLYAFSLSFAVSSFNKNISYRCVVALLISIFSLPMNPIMPVLQIFLFFAWAALFSHSSNIGTWQKYSWLIVPYSLIRAAFLWIFFFYMPFHINSCVSLDKDISGLLGLTYTIIIKLLLLDLLVNLLAKRCVVKKNLVENP